MAAPPPLPPASSTEEAFEAAFEATLEDAVARFVADNHDALVAEARTRMERAAIADLVATDPRFAGATAAATSAEVDKRFASWRTAVDDWRADTGGEADAYEGARKDLRELYRQPSTTTSSAIVVLAQDSWEPRLRIPRLETRFKIVNATGRDIRVFLSPVKSKYSARDWAVKLGVHEVSLELSRHVEQAAEEVKPIMIVLDQGHAPDKPAVDPGEGSFKFALCAKRKVPGDAPKHAGEEHWALLKEQTFWPWRLLTKTVTYTPEDISVKDTIGFMLAGSGRFL